MTPSAANLAELERELLLRTNQAKIRLDEMQRMCAAYEKELETLVISSNENGVTYYKIPGMPDPPKEISLLASEILHHLRSALDNLVVGLTLISANRTLTDAEEKPISFCILGLKSEFDTFQEKKLVLLNSEYIDLLFRLQPIDMGNDRDEDYNQWVRTALEDLALYSNQDKHRRLALTGQAVSGSGSSAGPGIVPPSISIGGVRRDENFASHATVTGHSEETFQFTVYFLHPITNKPIGISQALDEIYDAIQTQVVPKFFQ